MKRQSLLLLVFLCITHAKTILINVDTAYSNGEFSLEDIEYDTQDTIEFSNGIRLAPFKVPVGGGMGLEAYGGFIVIDSASTLTFDATRNRTTYHDEWDFEFTYNKIVKNWYKTLSIPQEHLAADTLFFRGNEDTTQSYPAYYFFDAWGPEGGSWFDDVSEGLMDRHKALSYIKASDGSNVKLQLYDCSKFMEKVGPDEAWCQSIYDFKFRWAVDSAGNGRFKHSVVYDTIDVQSHFQNEHLLNKYEFSNDEEIVEVTLISAATDYNATTKAEDDGIAYYTVQENDAEYWKDSLAYRVKTTKKTYDVFTQLNIKINESCALNDTIVININDRELEIKNGIIVTDDTLYTVPFNVLENDLIETSQKLKVITYPEHGEIEYDDSGNIHYTFTQDSVSMIYGWKRPDFDYLEYLVFSDDGKIGKAKLTCIALFDETGITTNVKRFNNAINLHVSKNSITYNSTNSNAIHEVKLLTLNGRVLEKFAVHSKPSKIALNFNSPLSTGFYIVQIFSDIGTKQFKVLVR